MNFPERFELTPTELSSPLWQKLFDHFTRRIVTLHMQNDGDLNETETAKLRGRIAECKSIMSLANPITTPPDGG